MPQHLTAQCPFANNRSLPITKLPSTLTKHSPLCHLPGIACCLRTGQWINGSNRRWQIYLQESLETMSKMWLTPTTKQSTKIAYTSTRNLPSFTIVKSWNDSSKWRLWNLTIFVTSINSTTIPSLSTADTRALIRRDLWLKWRWIWRKMSWCLSKQSKPRKTRIRSKWIGAYWREVWVCRLKCSQLRPIKSRMEIH